MEFYRTKPKTGDILILLTNGEIHEGEFVKILKDQKIYELYHIYKTNQYLTKFDVVGWLSKSKLGVHEYEPTVLYDTTGEKYTELEGDDK